MIKFFFGDVSTLYKSGNTTVDLKLDTYSNVSTKVIVLPYTKVACSFKIPDHKFGKLDVQYIHPFFFLFFHLLMPKFNF